ncbi:MAG TPA: anhydro-N-acetylmuramic acid kinase [Xanthobacteraceae bacterium]|nr:anhydro-N-acetylmuramic acid kinase [Xanthobacteraceae bacterium]
MGHVRAIGLMSGTSLDGVDVALIETDGESIASFGPTAFRPYTPPERELLRRALTAAVGLADRNARPGALKQAEALVTEAHAQAAERFLGDNGLASDIAVVGFHGQTVLHRPDAGLSVQLGDGRELARRLSLPVVFDFRAADVAAGGQGAPLVPVFHRALVDRVDRPGPTAVLNVGGVANLTYLDGSEAMIAFDTGPGNALIDDFMLARSGKAHDEGGVLAAGGQVDRKLVAGLLTHPFFHLPFPKSLDRNAFTVEVSGHSLADGAATLTALTAAAVARALDLLPRAPRTWIVGGGGARNATLMRMLAAELAPATVVAAHALGWSADALEAQAFAYLAVRTLRGLPITFPTTTGVAKPMTGGVVARP